MMRDAAAGGDRQGREAGNGRGGSTAEAEAAASEAAASLDMASARYYLELSDGSAERAAQMFGGLEERSAVRSLYSESENAVWWMVQGT